MGISLPNVPNEVPTFTTERLTLRATREQDAARLAEIVSLPEVVKALLLDGPRSEAQTRDWIRKVEQSAALGVRYTFAIVETATAELLGIVELNPVNVVTREAELTIWLAREARGHGYAREAGRQVLEWATAHLQVDVGGLSEPHNEASIALMRSLGMEDLGETDARSSRLGTVAVRHFIARRRP